MRPSGAAHTNYTSLRCSSVLLHYFKTPCSPPRHSYSSQLTLAIPHPHHIMYSPRRTFTAPLQQVHILQADRRCSYGL
ncbi:unnamed protein product [Peniophora sp. CBMAI 1063]|nr:unnamed protein product [Peniophora sp. CBMAI 1063]